MAEGLADASGAPPPDDALSPSQHACGACGGGSRYKCPRCGARSCSVACVRAHKEESGCTGKRDRAAFLPLAAMTDSTLVSDMRLLEETAAAAASARAAAAATARGPPPGAAAARLPHHLRALVDAAAAAGVRLRTLPAGMDARRRNTSTSDRSRGRGALRWRVEWRVGGVPSATWTDAKAGCDAGVGDLLGAHLKRAAAATPPNPLLAPYLAADPVSLAVLLRVEGRPANDPRWAAVDRSAPLAAALRGRTLVEFPTLTVVLPADVGDYPLEEAVAEGGEGGGEGGAAAPPPTAIASLPPPPP